MLKWAREHGCDWDAYVCAYAVLSGNFWMLKWARANGCPWDHLVCKNAALRGRLDMLQWARESGCEWRYDDVLRAARRYPKLLAWVQSQAPTS